MVKKKKNLQFQNKKWPKTDQQEVKSDQQGVKIDQLIKISKNLTKLVKNYQVGLKWPSWSWVTKLVMNDQLGPSRSKRSLPPPQAIPWN